MLHRLRAFARPRRFRSLPCHPSSNGVTAGEGCAPLVTLRDVSLRPFIKPGGIDPSDPMGIHFAPVLQDVNWSIAKGEHWALVGANGAGKTTLALSLRGAVFISRGRILHSRDCPIEKVGVVSFEQQCRNHRRQKQEMVRREFAARGRWPDPPTAGEAIGGRLLAAHKAGNTRTIAADITVRMRLHRLLEQPYFTLSSGEHRRLLIGEALAEDPTILILDEPFDGLDVAMRATVAEMLEEAARMTQIVLITHRVEEVLPFITHAAYLSRGTVVSSGPVAELHRTLQTLDHTTSNDLARLSCSIPIMYGACPISLEEVAVSTSGTATGSVDGAADAELPSLHALVQGYTGAGANGAVPGQSPTSLPCLLEVSDATVTYDGRDILKGVTWRVRPGENWAVTGPNGCGKSTLVRLVYADHPQMYSNDISILGRRRGTPGVSIWELRQGVGMVTPFLHLEYQHRPISAFRVVCSGFFDSVGLYRKASPEQELEARKWVQWLGIERLAEKPFMACSQGEQRMVLLARAMVKRPQVLLLDEPTHGLDAANRRHFLGCVDAIGRAGRCAVVCVTHHRDEVVSCITHELRLAQDGTVEHCGPV